jgi:hypothetical protein
MLPRLVASVLFTVLRSHHPDGGVEVDGALWTEFE